MQVRICSLLVFLVAMPAFCQVEPSAEGGATTPEVEIPMATPPLVSGIAYPNVVTADAGSNYFSAGVTVDAGYTDNVLQAATNTPVDDYTYIINPTFSYDRLSPRQHTTLTYNPGFTFYQPDSVLDSIDQTANFRFEERMSPRLAFNVTDFFMRTSDVFDASFPFPGGVGGTPQLPAPAVLAPFIEQTANDGSAALTYQFGANAMVGGGGGYSIFDFSNPNQAQGLYNSNGESASAFYTERFARNQYVGVDYQYSRMVATPPNVQVVTQTQTLLPFYSINFKRNFSASVAVGGQNTNVTQNQQPSLSSWIPAIVASTAWQSSHTSFALSYLRVITAGDGLVGPYTVSTVDMSGAWRITRNWRFGASGGYNTIEPTVTVTGQDYQGGNGFVAGANLGRTLGDRFTAGIEYERIQETFIGIPIIVANPGGDREYVTITYQIKKPLGR